ncbi:MAG: pre-peptidase C-terminal domain-containing protein, partial [Ilumatobacteraceae bacterium]
NTQCLAVCTWTREATVPDDDDAPVPDAVTWTVSTSADDGLTVGATLSPATVSPGDTMAIEVSADVSAGEVGETLFGWVTLTPDDPAVPTVTMPVAVVPSSGVLPDAVDVLTRRDAGSQLISGIESIAVSELTTAVAGMVRGTPQSGALTEDATNGDPYDDLDQVGVHLVEVPEGATRLVAEVIEAAMPDLDLFVGTGSVPSLETEVCVSASGGSQEACDIPDPQAGTWWVLVQNWEASGTGASDEYVVNTAVVPGTDLGNAGVTGPSGPIPVGQPYDVRFHWDIPEMEVGDTWYGTIVLGSAPDAFGDIGSFPVTIHREEDDVTKTASVTSATIGDSISYEVTVQPNVTPEDLVYTLVDTVPDGLTIDPGSVTGGGVVDGQTITWTVDVPSPAQQAATYVASTPASSPQCADWSGFLDLGAVGIPLSTLLDGDSVAVTAFPSVGPFEHYGVEFPNLVVSEDGLVTVTGGYTGAPWEPQEIPDAAGPNGVIAPLWSDLELSVADGRGMRLATSGAGAGVIQWDDPFEFTEDDTVGPSVGTFQAWVYDVVSEDRPEVTFEYETLGALPSTATIGIESILGDQATAVLNAGDPSSVLEDGGTICLDYEGPSYEPITVGYDVTVDAGAAPGTYTNALVHITDDPYAQPVTVSTDVEVDIECTRVLTGGRVGGLDVASGVTCLDGATVFGPITVRPGASLQIDRSLIVGSITSRGAEFVTVCGSILTGTVRLDGSSAVRFGDPSVGCGPNAVLGRVEVTNTAGPSVIGGNGIIGVFACTGNVPPPVNNGSPNSVLGLRQGQCATL